MILVEIIRGVPHLLNSAVEGEKKLATMAADRRKIII